ncbi:TPA: NAD(P)/FAD-dependent oxidoreductase [Pseudomonas putida]|nr:NAD(P)/FAD-dependent oxidoreductase [Pseudomonas putida]
MQFDVIIVGGSYAGISAALQLARARRKVLVIDAGQRRNRFARNAHGFLAQDGTDPALIAHQAREQLLAYPTVEWLAQAVVEGSKADQGFTVTCADGQTFTGARLILATGVVDELPDVPGLQERWGRSVVHCPYCHGYEMGGAAIGVLAASPLAMHHALLVPDWGPTTLFLNQVFEPDAEQQVMLAKRGVVVEREAVISVGGEHAEVTLASGRVIALAGLFTQPRTRIDSTLAQQLGCALEAGPTGDFIKVDALRETSVPGVFACGDAAVAAGNVAIAVGDGARAGGAAHQSLIFR